MERPGGLDLDRRLIKQCVHCGLCLDYCPTYRVLGLEMDSPRGRIFQVRQLMDGRLSPDDHHLREHIYLCLDCRACQTACPSGVQYGKIIEAARAVVPPPDRRAHAITRAVLNMVFTSNRLLDLVGLGLRFYQRSGLRWLVHWSGLLRLVSDGLAEAEHLLIAPQGGLRKPRLPETTAPLGERRHRVGFLAGCVMAQLMGRTNQATVRVLAANHCEVVVPPAQVCCGALHCHIGERETARVLARRNIAAFEKAGVEAVIVNAAGCGSALKEYGYLLRNDPEWAERARAFSAKVRDIAEFLVEIGLQTDGLGEVRRRVTYQDPCHLVHGQGIREQPRRLLLAVPGLELVEMKEADVCCGSAGVYNLTERQMSLRLLEGKVRNLAETGATEVVVPNPGCAMQIAYGARRYGLRTRVTHLVDVLDEAYRAGGRYSSAKQLTDALDH